MSFLLTKYLYLLSVSTLSHARNLRKPYDNNCCWFKVAVLSLKRGEEQNREEGEMAQIKLGGGRNRGKSREEGEKEKLAFREEGEIGSESREEGDLPPCSTPLT